MFTLHKVFMSAFLVILATYSTLYTLTAYSVARYASRGCWTCRGSIGDPTFFPFPNEPQGVVMDVIGKMDPVDQFIYLHLMETGVLIIVCILLWVFVVLSSFKTILPFFKAWKSTCTKREGVN